MVAIVEAKRDSLKDGLGQCIATMVGAQLFNEHEQTGITIIYGMVTTGSLWQCFGLKVRPLPLISGSTISNNPVGSLRSC